MVGNLWTIHECEEYSDSSSSSSLEPCTSPCIYDSPLPSLADMKQEIETWTPVNLANWTNVNNWSPESRNWFNEHLPLFEIECLMGMDPMTNSLQDYLDTFPMVPLEAVFKGLLRTSPKGSPLRYLENRNGWGSVII